MQPATEVEFRVSILRIPETRSAIGSAGSKLAINETLPDSRFTRQRRARNTICAAVVTRNGNSRDPKLVARMKHGFRKRHCYISVNLRVRVYTSKFSHHLSSRTDRLRLRYSLRGADNIVDRRRRANNSIHHLFPSPWLRQIRYRSRLTHRFVARGTTGDAPAKKLRNSSASE